MDVTKYIKASLILIISAVMVEAQQPGNIYGIVKDEKTGEPLTGASISIFHKGHVEGIITNKEGKFIFSGERIFDSLKFSMIGYHSSILSAKEVSDKNFIDIRLVQSPSVLAEVLIKPPLAIDVVREAINKIPSLLPTENF